VLLIPKRHGQTDGQTDGRLTVALPRSALASRGKNSRRRFEMAPFHPLYLRSVVGRSSIFILLYTDLTPLSLRSFATLAT